ncbi:MAG: methyl-accepting chemotaxis protein [Pseudomonadota bacterium]
MRRFLSAWRIGPRLTLGFGAVLGLLLVTATVAGLGLFTSVNSFGDYQRFSGTVGHLSQGQADLLAARIVMKDLYLDFEEAVVPTIEQRLDGAARAFDSARGGITDATTANAMAELDRGLADYRTTFEDMRQLVGAYHAVFEEMVRQGNAVEADVNTLFDRLAAAENAMAQAHIGNARYNFTAVRAGVLRFVMTQGESGRAAVDRRLAAARAAAVRLTETVVGQDRRDAQDLVAGLDEYTAYADQLLVIVGDMAPAAAALDRTGGTIAEGAERLATEFDRELGIIGPRTVSVATTALIVAIGVAVISLLVGFVLSRLLGRSIAEPLSGMTQAMEKIAEGELKTEVPSRDAKDEMGDLAGALEVFKKNAIEREKLEKAQAERVKKMDKAIKSFDAEVNVALTEVDGASTQLGDSATTMVAAAGQASSNVQAVATAAEEMSASVAEISNQTGTSRTVAGDAVKAVNTASRVVDELAATAQQITGIVDLISDIADQTNLLALNAAIEAARAGEAGKGFAVVAHEVKTLASRTGQATADIAQKVQGITHGSEEAVKMIGQVNEVMQRIDEIATAIAGAIEEQSAVTTSIAQNAQEAAQGTESVVETIRGKGDGRTADARSSVIGAAQSLGEQSAKLKERVQGFLAEIRAA